MKDEIITNLPYIDPSKLYGIITSIFQKLEDLEKKDTFAFDVDLPMTLDKIEEMTGTNQDTLYAYIRNGVLPRRQMVKSGLLFLYPSDLKNALNEPKTR